MRKTLSSSLLLVLLLPALLPAADWPGWRGAERNGQSPETGLLQTWPEGGPPLAWKAKGLGSGYSSVSVADGKIFTMGDVGKKQFVLALSLEKEGKQLWKTSIGPSWEDEYLGPRSTPTYDDGRVYALSTEGLLVALDAETGKEIWKRDLVADFGASVMKARGQWDWKFAESPLVDGDRVIVTPGVRDAALVALDKKTGEEIWRAKIPLVGIKGADGAGYSSVVISNGAGVKQYVQLFGRGVFAVEAATGKYLWGYNKVANDVANIPTPIVDGDHVFASTGYGAGSVLLHLTKTEDGVAAEEVYFLSGDTMQNHHGGLILRDGTIYTGTGHNRGFPLATEMATGKIAWGPVRNDGQSSAAITYADGRIYFRYQNGTMILVEATPEEYREHGSFDIPDVRQFSWSHPVISDGKLYLREQENLYVYDVSAAKAPAPAANEAAKD